MQLMWVSGPTGSVRTISITARKVLMSLCAVSLALITTGFLLYLVGFKLAIEIRPELARSLGGVTTEAEQQKMELAYRKRLLVLQGALDSTAQEIRELQALKNRFVEIATPTSMRDKRNSSEEGKGGPFVSPNRPAGKLGQPLMATFDDANDEFGQFQKLVVELRHDWLKQLAWLKTLPTGLPVGSDARMSSGFGMRNDPFTGALARHEGLDFTATTGTPILATADGVVTRSGWEETYGNIIEVTHAEGFMTRYAHIHIRLAVEGQKVLRGQHIADVGSTGRSTGPHLHYEVFRFGKVLNPLHVLPAGSSS